jgi:uncharacterized protein YceK
MVTKTFEHEMKKTLLAISILVACVFGSGCGTVCRGLVSETYPATKFDKTLVWIGTSPQDELTETWAYTYPVVERPLFVIVGVVDFPISLITDTVLYPYDRWKLKKEAEINARKGARTR